MKTGKWARLLFVAAPLLVAFTSGCGDFWQAPSNGGGGGGTVSTTTLSSGIFYVLNAETAQVVSMSINTGVLTTISSETLAAQPVAMALAPSGNFLYVSTDGGIFVYAVSSTGTLTLGNNGQAISGDQAITMQVDATGNWLIDGVLGNTTIGAEVNAIAISPSTGLLAASGEKEIPVGLPTGTTTITQLAISPNDSNSCNSCYVFVGLGTSGTEIIAFNPGNADPFGGSGNRPVLNAEGSDNTVAVDPTNRLLYVGESVALPAETQSGGLRVFTIGSGGITEISGSPFSTGGTGPSAILPQADYVYVANESVGGSSTGNIASFTLTSTGTTSPTYTIASIGTVSAGSTPLSLSTESKGNFLLTVNSGGPDLEGYTMSAGSLTSVLTGPTGTDPVEAIAIVAAP
jgi:6-phosphogluconolactonase (cycloisomerase 2 family)